MNPLMLKLRAQLRRARRQPLRPAARRADPLGGPHLHPAHGPALRRDPDGLRRLLGRRRLGRPLAVGEPPLHGRGLPGLLRPPDARRRDRHPALGRRHPAPRLERGGACSARRRPAGAWRCCSRTAREHSEDPPQMVFMLKKRPFTPEEAQLLAGLPNARPIIVPGQKVEEPYASLFAGETTFAQYVARGDDARRPRLRRPAVLLRAPEAVGPAQPHAQPAAADPRADPGAAGALPRVRQAAGRAGRAVRQLARLLREPRCRLHRGGARAAAAPDAAARAPDLHALDPALHAARLRRDGQRLGRPAAARARLPRRSPRSPRSTRSCCRGSSPRCCSCRSPRAS